MNTQIKFMPHLVLIGMSNIGKSSWSRRLERAGYRRVDCDSLIAARLLGKRDGDVMGALADWMGFPGTAAYEANSRLYAEAEAEVVRDAVAGLRDDTPTVIDTTGSVIYAPADVLAALRASARILYLDTSGTHTDWLYRRYVDRPKPVLWDGQYRPSPDEAPDETRRRCYPDLLRDRAARYAALAHATVPFARHQDRRADPLELFLS